MFPLDQAVAASLDTRDLPFYYPEYDDSSWENVSLPHTFNDADLFSKPIEDAGSHQTRCVAFYRNTLIIPDKNRNDRVLIAFEGIRQTCYLYVNGHLAGYYEAGVGPFGFELTRFLDPSGRNVIAIATDNTSTRNIPFCIAETPNHPEAIPGHYLQPQDAKVPVDREGVGYFWNCNDFNPTLGGITQPVRIHFKKDIYLTLPLYSNLQTHGTYIYGTDFDFSNNRVRVNAEVEVKNLRSKAADIRLELSISDTKTGNEEQILCSSCFSIPASDPESQRLSERLTIVPEDAYSHDPQSGKWIPADEDHVEPTKLSSIGTNTFHLDGILNNTGFWSVSKPNLYKVRIRLFEDGHLLDEEEIETGFRKTAYDKDRGILINDRPIWLRGYAQRSTNEWAAAGIVPQWMHDYDAALIRESNANHIRFMHVAASLTDIRSCDRFGIVVTQPAGDKERENFGRQWDQRVELMRNIIIAFRNHPSIVFWEAGNNSLSPQHMQEMRLLKLALDPEGGRFMGCRSLNTEEAVSQAEYTGTMLNRHASRFFAEMQPVIETEYSREEAPRRIPDDFTPPDFDYRCKWVGKGGGKQKGMDFHDHTEETLALANAAGYSEFFNHRVGGASGQHLYSGCAALCWTDSAQHGRQSWSENGRMSGRVDPVRIKKQSFDVFRVMQSTKPAVKILGHWNYPPLQDGNYFYRQKEFNGKYWQETEQILRRDPTNKAVYCVASYPVASVKLFVNHQLAGTCSKPEHSFIFSFPGVNVLEKGYAEAVGYDFDGIEICLDRLETVDEAVSIQLMPITSPCGFSANGTDIAMVDVLITDMHGNIVPLADHKINFTLTGDAVFLGGYNSGRFDGNNRMDNVIHKPFVFAECGTNRVFIRAGLRPGTVKLTASASGLPAASVELTTVPADNSPLSSDRPAFLLPDKAGFSVDQEYFYAIPESDRLKYTPEDKEYCKIMFNGQEPDFRGVRAVNKNGSIWGNVICILERIRTTLPGTLDYDWDKINRTLTLKSGGRTVIAECGETHLRIDGNEELMDGAPYLTDEGILVMEVNALAVWIEGASVRYDERIRALRIDINK